MSTRKPQRPGLPGGREAIAVPGLPSHEPAPTPAHTPPAPTPYPGIQEYGQARTTPPARRPRRPSTAKREDPPGMARTSYYITEDAQAAMEAAVAQVQAILGDDVPKHVALSALIHAGAAQAAQVAGHLAHARAAELARRVDALRATTHT